MYGVVNKAIEDLIVSRYGEAAWIAIKARAGVDTEVFVSNEGYPDQITYDLVAAATERLDLPARDILIAFGEHWVLRTGLESYGPLLRSGGTTLKEFLVNLPKFHTRVQLLYPGLRPPTFECSDIRNESLHLHYHTHRPGLSDFVVGLVRGLGQLYGTATEVVLLESREAGADHDVFAISWKTPGT